MLQHFGNFRVILRVNLAGRSRAKILQLQRQSQFLVHVFSQNRKLHRADFQYLLMKTFQIKVFAVRRKLLVEAAMLQKAVQKAVQKRFDRLPIQAMPSVKSSVSTKVRLWTICPHLPAVW